ncbi:MAG: hypothetical protein R2713_13830 [Ilumatobacteraceae bacterium]|nr:hypothetical protein [Acidimicrobiales bacterium]MCB9392134.1 hypothetical protein [Acidimicrobiaceae bacterium]
MRATHHHHVAGADLLADQHHDARQHPRNRATPWFLLAAVALLAAISVGCGGGDESSDDGAGDDASAADVDATDAPAALENVFDTDFLVACDGVGFPAAAPYDTTAGTISPVVVLAGEGTAMYGRYGAVREAWTRQWTTENPLALAEIQLVACAEKVSATQVQECTGYEVDGVVTDNVVILNEVTYEVSLHEAATGTEVASTTITARDEDCPMFVSFTEGDTTEEHDSFDDLAIQAFVEQYVVH